MANVNSDIGIADDDFEAFRTASDLSHDTFATYNKHLSPVEQTGMLFDGSRPSTTIPAPYTSVDPQQQYLLPQPFNFESNESFDPLVPQLSHHALASEYADSPESTRYLLLVAQYCGAHTHPVQQMRRTKSSAGRALQVHISLFPHTQRPYHQLRSYLRKITLLTAYRRHMDSHTKPYICPDVQCPRHTNGFFRRHNLISHITIHGDKKRNRSSPTSEGVSPLGVDKRYKRASELRRHVKTHTLPHCCNKCGYRTAEERRLQNHKCELKNRKKYSPVTEEDRIKHEQLARLGIKVGHMRTILFGKKSDAESVDGDDDTESSENSRRPSISKVNLMQSLLPINFTYQHANPITTTQPQHPNLVAISQASSPPLPMFGTPHLPQQMLPQMPPHMPQQMSQQTPPQMAQQMMCPASHTPPFQPGSSMPHSPVQGHAAWYYHGVHQQDTGDFVLYPPATYHPQSPIPGGPLGSEGSSSSSPPLSNHNHQSPPGNYTHQIPYTKAEQDPSPVDRADSLNTFLQDETEVTKILMSGMTSGIIVHAICTFPQHEVHRRLFRILKTFSKNIRVLAIQHIEKESCDFIRSRATIIATKMVEIADTSTDSTKYQRRVQLLEEIGMRYSEVDLSQRTVAKVGLFRAHDAGTAEERSGRTSDAVLQSHPSVDGEEDIEQLYEHESDSEHSEGEDTAKASQLIKGTQTVAAASKFLRSDRVQDMLLHAVKQRFPRSSLKKEPMPTELVPVSTEPAVERYEDSLVSVRELSIPKLILSPKEAVTPATHLHSEIPNPATPTAHPIGTMQIPGSWPGEYAQKGPNQLNSAPMK
ncbi:hypothetical protein BDD12DRAFT_979285 [Trichophaea hybrida]|nr:hypothetical protein BDD12DRAFT_979285 [Trichophaea hybrida]